MRNLPLILLLAVAAGTPACLGADGRTNQEACQEYVEAINAIYADCDEEIPFDVDSECPDSLNAYAGDCTVWFDCVRNAYWCDDEGDVGSNYDHCESCY